TRLSPGVSIFRVCFLPSSSVYVSCNQLIGLLSRMCHTDVTPCQGRALALRPVLLDHRAALDERELFGPDRPLHQAEAEGNADIEAAVAGDVDAGVDHRPLVAAADKTVSGREDRPVNHEWFAHRPPSAPGSRGPRRGSSPSFRHGACRSHSPPA